MNISGIALCARYSYPPNSFSLCGPDKKADLEWYLANQISDKGTVEILSQFSTLYPYLTLIARENNIKDPFDPKVVEAYWLGNNLLYNIKIIQFGKHLMDSLQLKKKTKRKKDVEILMDKIIKGGLPHHSFHVFNVYQRTGNVDEPYTIETMDACIINWGTVIKILPQGVIVKTKTLKVVNNLLTFGKTVQRTIFAQSEKDILFKQLTPGNWISYHWGYFCTRLTEKQLKNLIYYNDLAMKFANCL